MRYRKELSAEAAEFEDGSDPYLDCLHVKNPGFLEAHADQAQRQRRGVNRRRQSRQQKSQGADMVFVPVRDQVRAQLVATLFHVTRVRDDVIHPVHLFGWKQQSGVDDDQVVGCLEDHHVATDVA